MRAILLVGGRGTRLRPLTLSKPKGLLPILNKPFLTTQLDLLKQGGVREVLLAAGKKSRHFERDLVKVTPKGMKLFFAYEKTLLGTGGAIRFAYDEFRRQAKFKQDTMVVLNGDVFIDLKLKQIARQHDRNGSDCSIALIKVDDPSRFGLVITNQKGRIRQFKEKPKTKRKINLINAGAYLLSSQFIERIPPKKVLSIERDVFPRQLKRKVPMFGFRISGYWNDIGTPQSYLQAHLDLIAANKGWTPTKFLRKTGITVGKKTTISRFCSLGRQVRIGDGCTIRNSVLLDGVNVGDGAVLDGVIAGPRSKIGKFSNLSKGMVLGEDSYLSPYTKC